ncbi:MAG: hypothetical protein L3J21_07910 [Devosiaceae bacterium]|nr:hypothetical protein [Devosiaceae bacterium]
MTCFKSLFYRAAETATKVADLFASRRQAGKPQRHFTLRCFLGSALKSLFYRAAETENRKSTFLGSALKSLFYRAAETENRKSTFLGSALLLF